jgi:hypothetical protein
MKHSIAFAMGLFFLFWLGCSPVNQPGFGTGNSINFYNLRVGQKNQYVSFTIVNDTVKTYGKDTAVVEITGTYGSGFVFSANFSPGSMSFTQASPIVQYGVIIRNDTCNATLLLNNSVFLSQLIPYQNFPLSYMSEGSVPFKSLSPTFCSWVINYQTPSHISFHGTTTACTTSNYSFDTLNIIINSSLPSSSGAGTLWVFSKDTGFLYTMSYGAKSAMGWEFLP